MKNATSRFLLRPLLGSALIVTACLLPAQSPAQTLVDFECDEPVCSIFCTDTLDVYVTVDAGAADLRGYSFVLEFDPLIIQPVSVQPGPLDTASCGVVQYWVNETAVGDSIYVDGAGLGCSLTGPGRIVHLRFVGVMEGTSVLRCRSSILRDSTNADIPHTCDETTISFSCPPVPAEPTRWGSIKLRHRELE